MSVTRVFFHLTWLLGWAAPVHGQPAPAADWVKLDVPYVGTPPTVMNAMLDLAAVGPGDVVYDLGSGDGRIVIAAVRERGATRGVGIELNPRRVADAVANAQAAGVADRVSFVAGDIFTADFSAASVVTMYLLDNVNLRLRPRLLDDLNPGTRVVSHQFHMFDWTPDQQVTVLDNVPVRLWVVPAKAAGRWSGTAGATPITLDLAQSFQMITGRIVVGEVAGEVRLGRLNGADLTVETVLGGAQQPVRLSATVSADGLAGTLTLDGATQSVVLRR
jgi:SAM-dependent methyltransferase